MQPDRYQRQTLLPQIGPQGQAQLARARAILIGCGALGTVLADALVRAGIGHLSIVDRDLVEWSNLHRQVLFDEADAKEGAPKAVAAARRLRAINSAVSIESIVADLNSGNVESTLGLEPIGAVRLDLILDGTDNAATRYLLNDVSVKHGVPWIYGACVGTEGRMMTVRPGATACLRCVFPEPPGPGELPTCDTAGVLGPAAGVVASLQAAAAIKLLIGATEAVEDQLISLDVWSSRFRAMSLVDARRDDCPTCGLRRFNFLDAPLSDFAALCGRDAVQIRPARKQRDASSIFDLKQAASRLRGCGTVEQTPYLIRCQLNYPPGVHLTLFPDGRLIVHGVTDIDRARSLYARYIGA